MQNFCPPQCFLCLLFLVATETSCFADLVLTGAGVYWASDNQDGSIINDPFNPGYRFTTNLADTEAVVLSINGQLSKGISVPLFAGDNVITFTGDTMDSLAFVGLNLFFTDTDGISDNSFNPDTASGIAGDITVFKQVNTPENIFATATSGVSIRSFGTSYMELATANGRSSFQLGDQVVSVSAFSSNQFPLGSFTLTVISVPEPSSLALVSISSVSVMVRRRKAFQTT